ncbi:MAG TPA: PA domain-containing protein [Herpetosiphonaceae bacterium]|nr:PA domain-containing protein [Herpetosiphonaceae bacterium]
MKRRFMLLAGIVALLVLLVGPALAHPEHGNGRILTAADDGSAAFFVDEKEQHGGESGHLPASNKNVELIGKIKLTEKADGIADVAAFGNYAYLAAFRPECGQAGVHVVNISDPANPQKAAFIPASANSYVGEGVHVIRAATPTFKGDLLIHNNEPCNTAIPGGTGISLWDVTDPTRPQLLAAEVGDMNVRNFGTAASPNLIPQANSSHSAQGWTVGDKAYVVLVDNQEAKDVDIMDITDPRNPVLIAEVGLADWPIANKPLMRGNSAIHHDMQVQQINGNWFMMVSYWDAGYILLNINDPANPTFVNDFKFPTPDPLTGFALPEGNAHQSYWSSNNQFIMATDEDFSPYRLVAKITSGAFNGTEFTATPARGIPQVTPDKPLIGPTVFVGLACDPGSVPDAPSANAIAVAERGTCAFQTKADSINAKGYAGGLVMNMNAPGACEALVNMLVRSSNVPMLFVARSVGYQILGIEGYNPNNCPGGSNPALPAVGSAGSNVDIQSVFDGWGYVHLMNATTLKEVDAYAVAESLDPTYAVGYGNLTVHEVKTDPRPNVNLAYLSYYDAGLRVVKFGKNGIQEAGHYIAEGGSDFWGTFPHSMPANPKANGGAPYLLMSDRDSGLWIFRYTGE